MRPAAAIQLVEHAPVVETRVARGGRTFLYLEDPRTTDYVGCPYGPTEECKTAAEARAAALRDLLEESSEGAR